MCCIVVAWSRPYRLCRRGASQDWTAATEHYTAALKSISWCKRLSRAKWMDVAICVWWPRDVCNNQGLITCPQLFWLPHDQPNRHNNQAFANVPGLFCLGLLGLHGLTPECRVSQ